MEGPEKKKLRVALMMDSFHPTAWAAESIRNIAECGYAEIVLIVLDSLTKNDPPERKVHPTEDKRGNWLWRQYSRLDNKLSRIGSYYEVEQDPFEPIDLCDILKDIPVIEVKPLREKYIDRFHENDLEKIRAENIDVILRFGFLILKGDILRAAKYGVWSHHHGDSRFYRGGPPSFWECMNSESHVGAELQILTEKLNAGKVIYRSWSKSEWYSMKLGRYNNFWKSSYFAVRKLKDLYNFGESALNEVSDSSEYGAYSTPLYKLPTKRRLIYYLTVQFFRMARATLSKIWYRFQWFLAFKISDLDHALDTFYDYDYIIPPHDRTWGDPFVVYHEGDYYIFLEEFLFSDIKGHLSVIKVDEKGEYSDSVKIISENYHLSYPFVFKWKDEWFMIPESFGNRTIDLYKSEEFPYKWRHEKTLFDNIRAVDTTVHEHNGKLWMFVNCADSRTSLNEELYVYYADDIYGPWIAHKRNPVKSDVRSTRPAGKLFYWKGNLYRPSQDCSVRYGYAITMNRILKLTEEEFEEAEVSKIYPSWKPGMIGNHMLNRDGRMTVIDAYRRVQRFKMYAYRRRK